MTTWLLLLLVTLPIPWIAKVFWPREIKIPEIGLIVLVSTLLISLVYFAGKAGMTMDREIWNSQVTSKERNHGQYQRSYDCNCRQVCSGSGKNQSCSSQCDTCYEDRYTVRWIAKSNIRDYSIASEDWGSRRVYQLPDPPRYTVIKPGDPVSDSRHFTNYVKAVPESLFHANAMLKQKYVALLPEYPGQIFDHYKINRVIAAGVKVPDLASWNEELSKTLRVLGPQKQANAIIIFVNTLNSDFQQALEGHWTGGKKNDIIIIIGATNYPKIDWVGVSSWSKAEIFKVQLRDDIMALGEVKQAEILKLLETHALKSFVRRQMKEFEYLEKEIEPPDWVVILAALLGLISSIGLCVYFYRNDPFESYNGFRR